MLQYVERFVKNLHLILYLYSLDFSQAIDFSYSL